MKTVSSEDSSARSKPGKYRELELHLRDGIANGTWAPGDRLPSFAELREQFGMAPSTVSHALQQVERDGLVVRRPGIGIFVTEPSNRTLKGVIGFHGFSFRERYVPYWMNLMAGVQEAAHDSEFEVLLLSGESEVNWEKVDGVLVHGDHPLPQTAMMPHVSVMRTAQALPTVTADDFQGAAAAVEHLLSLGHRRIGYLCFTGADVIHPRLAGYRAALLNAGVAAAPSWVRDIAFRKTGGSSRELARVNMENWLADGWRETGCTALLAQNDVFAQGVVDAFKEAGIRVPRDVSVIGYDGTEVGLDSDPPLTSVVVPLEKIGASAVEMLLRLVRGERMDAVTLSLPTQLVVRGSTAVAPKSAANVGTAGAASRASANARGTNPSGTAKRRKPL